jgi:acyl-CoA synthetase (AMP-forming)/AMP-acid ligase II
MRTNAKLMSNLSSLFTEYVQQQPERTAVGTSDRRIMVSYRQLDALIKSVVAQLSCFGLKQGETVALVSDNSVEFVLGFFGIVSSGARVAPLNPALTSSELAARLEQLSARAVLVPQHLANKPAFADSIAESTSFWIIEIEGSESSSEVRIADKKGTRNPEPVLSQISQFVPRTWLSCSLQAARRARPSLFL